MRRGAGLLGSFGRLQPNGRAPAYFESVTYSICRARGEKFVGPSKRLARYAVEKPRRYAVPLGFCFAELMLLILRFGHYRGNDFLFFVFKKNNFFRSVPSVRWNAVETI